jgi:hypothetical protein
LNFAKLSNETAQWPAGKIGGLTGEEATLIQLVLSSILLRGSVRLLPYASKKTEKISIPRKRKRGIMAPHLSRDREKKGGEKELFYSGRPHSNSSSMHTLSAASLSSNPLTAPRFFFFSKSSPLFPPFLLLLPNWLKLWCFLK